MEKHHTLFAFKLAAKEDAKVQQAGSTGQQKWQPRDGVAIAGCTRHGRWDVKAYGLLGADSGLSC